MRRAWIGCLVVVVPAMALSVDSVAGAENRVVLRDGFELRGEVKIEENRIEVESGARKYVFGNRQLLQPTAVASEAPPERFALEQPLAKRGMTLPGVVRIVRVGPFDAWGRRSVVLRDARGREVNVIQGITELYPTHVVLRGIKRRWRSAMSVARIPTGQLVPILLRSGDAKKFVDQLKVVQFLLQAKRFGEAKTRLEAIESEFPGEQSRIGELRDRLRRGVTERALALADQALATGQVTRADELHGSLADYPIPPDRRVEWSRLGTRLEALTTKIGRARELSKTAVRVDDPEQQAIVDEAIAEISTSITPASVARLEPMLALADQADVTPTEQLALAMTGWTVGPKLADRDLDRAVRLWRQRRALLDAVRADGEGAFAQALERLTGLGAKPDLLLQMAPLLPAPATEAEPEKPLTITFSTEDFEGLRYHVLLPPEYDRYRDYPTVVTLHGLDTTPERQLEFWSRTAAEHGYVVIAPEYRFDQSRPYGYSVREHVAFLETLADARRRFAIDADKVFLSGHDLGGFAAWDLGMSHPDQFAGLIPFTSAPRFYCERYLSNLALLPVITIDGSFNGDNPFVTAQQCLKYFAAGYDAIYVEYHGRGGEMFSAELPTLFEWMSVKRREPAPREFSVTTARLSDRRFYWLKADSMLKNATVPPELFGKAKFRAAKISAKVNDDNSVRIRARGLESMSVYLPARLVHLDDPDLAIHVNGKRIHRGTIEPDLETMLRELVATGDRKNLVVKRIEVPRL